MLRLLILLLVACGGPPRHTSSIASARMLDHRGELDAAHAQLTRALADAKDDRAATAAVLAELARLAGTRVLFATNTGVTDGLATAREAQQAARAAGARHALAVALDAEGMLLYARTLWAGTQDFATSRAVFEQAVIAYRAAGDSAGAAEATFHVGLAFEQAGDPTAAAEHYRRALEARDDAIASYAERHLAGMAAERGDLEAARRGFARSLALREQLGLLRLVPPAHIALADLELQAGAIDAAIARYRRAFALATQLGQPIGLMWAHLALGTGLEKAGARDEARTHFEQALVLAEQAQVAVGIAAVKAALQRSGS